MKREVKDENPTREIIRNYKNQDLKIYKTLALDQVSTKEMTNN